VAHPMYTWFLGIVNTPNGFSIGSTVLAHISRVSRGVAGNFCLQWGQKRTVHFCMHDINAIPQQPGDGDSPPPFTRGRFDHFSNFCCNQSTESTAKKARFPSERFHHSRRICGKLTGYSARSYGVLTPHPSPASYAPACVRLLGRRR